MQESVLKITNDNKTIEVNPGSFGLTLDTLKQQTHEPSGSAQLTILLQQQ